MTAETKLEIRPRTLGEIADDAWRLALADAPLLLALTGLFAVPAFVVLLLLLTRPVPASWLARCALPALAALLWPLTGLGSGACQELFRRRAEGKSATLGRCLRTALRLGLGHIAGRTLTLFLLLPGLACLGAAAWLADGFHPLQLLLVPFGLFLVPVPLWLTHAIHPTVAAGELGVFGALKTATSREVQRNSTRAAVLAGSRLAMYLLVVLNLFVIVELFLWAAGSLAGLDVALADLLLAPQNPVYVLTLVALAWLLLAPYSEAANFLLHLDGRVRHDGLDLWYRLQSLFPALDRERAATVLLAAAGLLFLAAPARAEDSRLKGVREVRQELRALTEEVRTVNPYPADGRYELRLRRLADRLDAAAEGQPGRYRWFRPSVEGFGKRTREEALEVLTGLDERLALVEESLEAPPDRPEGAPQPTRAEVKALLPGGEDVKDDPRMRPEPRKEETEPKRPVQRDGPAGGGGGGAVAPQAGSGLDRLGWMLLGGLLLAVVVVALLFFFQGRRARPPEARPAAGASAPDPHAVEIEPEQRTPAELWRRAEAMARKGDFLEGVRFLYLAALTLLHEASLIRYDRTRTNGEYLRQLRTSAGADGVVEPFDRLTRLFELKWYGERDCRPDDYDSCRDLASQLREALS
jgi:hypothetical protein